MSLSELDALKQKRAEYQAMVEVLDAQILALAPSQKKPVDWKNRALQYLRIQKIPLRTIDVYHIAITKDPSLKIPDYGKRRLQFQALSVALNSQCDNGTLQRIQMQGFKGYFYGLSDWFTAKGKVKSHIQQRLEEELWSNPNSIFKLSGLKSVNTADNDLL